MQKPRYEKIKMKFITRYIINASNLESSFLPHTSFDINSTSCIILISPWLSLLYKFYPATQNFISTGTQLKWCLASWPASCSVFWFPFHPSAFWRKCRKLVWQTWYDTRDCSDVRVFRAPLLQRPPRGSCIQKQWEFFWVRAISRLLRCRIQ